MIQPTCPTMPLDIIESGLVSKLSITTASRIRPGPLLRTTFNSVWSVCIPGKVTSDFTSCYQKWNIWTLLILIFLHISSLSFTWIQLNWKKEKYLWNLAPLKKQRSFVSSTISIMIFCQLNCFIFKMKMYYEMACFYRLHGAWFDIRKMKNVIKYLSTALYFIIKYKFR